MNLDSRFKIHKRELVKLKIQKNGRSIFGDKIVVVRGEQRDRTKRFIEEASRSTPRF